jgi:hypothetical protein
MHGSSFTGDCAQALDGLNVMLRDVFGQLTLNTEPSSSSTQDQAGAE